MTSEAKTSNKERGGHRHGISDINIKVVLVARELVRREEENPEIVKTMQELLNETDEKLCIMVKEYFEHRRECKVELTEEVYKGENIRDFKKHIEINGYSIILKFNADSDGRWKYTISCDDVETKDFIPPQNKDFQGQLKIRFFYKKNGRTQETREQTINILEYP